MPTATRALRPDPDSPEYQEMLARDRERLEAMKARMAALAPDQRLRVAKRALAMSYQRRSGIKPTYLLTRLETTSKSSAAAAHRRK